MLKQFLITILLGVAITLGYAIYLQKKHQPPVAAIASTPTPSASSREADEAFLLSITDQSSEEDKRKHYLLASRMAQESAELKIKDCKVDPLVLRAKNNQMIKVKNEDAIAYNLGFNQTVMVAVPPNSTKEFPATFGSGPALYGYGYQCEQNATRKAFVLVVP